MDSAGPHKKLIAALVKGLGIIQAFDAERPGLRLTESPFVADVDETRPI